MKYLVFAVAVFTLGLSLQAFGAAEAEPFMAKLEEVFLPHGYDTDDIVEITYRVDLPDSCHRVTSVNTQVVHSSHVRVAVWIKNFGGSCHQGPIPMTSTISLGRLRMAGTYRIEDDSTGETVGAMLVLVPGRSPHGTDDNLYPALTDAFLERDGETNVLVLRGTFTDSCQSLKEVKFYPQKNVLVAIPVLNHPEGAECAKGMTPFEERVEVTEAPSKGSFLLHVRGVGGQSINKINLLPAVK